MRHASWDDDIHSCPRLPVHLGLLSLTLADPSLVQYNHTMWPSHQRPLSISMMVLSVSSASPECL